ncbi:MAG: DUF72 domain-containing protein [Ignavibacteriales bacterium]|nr:MAG: DUF72 domain-containing protein [Ignavibacteriales bacterium]
MFPFYLSPFYRIKRKYRKKKKKAVNWNKIIEPQQEELEKIVDITNYFSSKNIDVYLNVNNHYEGSVPLTIQKIQSLLKG